MGLTMCNVCLNLLVKLTLKDEEILKYCHVFSEAPQEVGGVAESLDHVLHSSSPCVFLRQTSPCVFPRGALEVT